MYENTRGTKRCVNTNTVVRMSAWLEGLSKHPGSYLGSKMDKCKPEVTKGAERSERSPEETLLFLPPQVTPALVFRSANTGYQVGKCSIVGAGDLEETTEVEQHHLQATVGRAAAPPRD